MYNLIVPFLLGTIIVANITSNPSVDGAFRINDFVIIILATASLFRLFFVRIPLNALIGIFLISLYLTIWLIFSYMIGDDRGVITSGRLVAGLLTALFLLTLWRKSDQWVLPFLNGLVFGGLVITIIGLGQKFNLGDIFFSLRPPSTESWWVLKESRETSIYSHPNGFSHHAMLGAIAALACMGSLEKKQNTARNILFGFSFLFITLSVYYASGTRAGLIIAFIGLLQLFSNQKTGLAKSIVGILAVSVIFSSPLFLEDVLGKRWFAGSSGNMAIVDNGLGRLSTTYTTFVKIIENPIGYGVSGRTEILVKEFGTSASHNSILSIGMSFGILLTTTLIFFYAYSLFKTRKCKNNLYRLQYLIVSSFVSLFFEDVIYSSAMSTFIPVLLVLAIFTQGSKNTNRFSEIKSNKLNSMHE